MGEWVLMTGGFGDHRAGAGRGNSLGHQGQESLNKVGCSTPEALTSMPPHLQLVPFYPNGLSEY